MGLLSFLFGSSNPSNGSFFSKADYSRNRAKQLALAATAVEAFKAHGAATPPKVKVRYHFFTNTQEKSEALSRALCELGFAAGFGQPDSTKPLYVVIGVMAELTMDEAAAARWTTQMCDIGQQHDCGFEGWSHFLANRGQAGGA